MGRTSTGAPAFRFMPSEVGDMEKALESCKGATPARSVIESLSAKFSNERAGQRPVQWKQVWNWFQNRRHSQKTKGQRTPEKLKAIAVGSDASLSGRGPLVTGRKGSDPQQLDFEAKSVRDGAWYDVSSFISRRTTASGEPEVCVRFSGFGAEEDEWVLVKTAVRQRSLPCEASECVAVLPGDLILCFQEGNEQALYFDADILDVQRRRHDVRGCRCRFWEVVPLRKVCRRPETEQRLHQPQGQDPGPQAGTSTSNTTTVTPSQPAPGGEVSRPSSAGIVQSASIQPNASSRSAAAPSLVPPAEGTPINAVEAPGGKSKVVPLPAPTAAVVAGPTPALTSAAVPAMVPVPLPAVSPALEPTLAPTATMVVREPKSEPEPAQVPDGDPSATTMSAPDSAAPEGYTELGS